MNLAELTRIAEQEIDALNAKLPADLAPLAAQVAVHVAAKPDVALLADGYEEDLLGLFEGTPYNEALASESPLPPQIFIYVKNIYDEAGEVEEEFRAEVRITYLHELGHYLGWDEDDLERRGLA